MNMTKVASPRKSTLCVMACFAFFAASAAEDRIPVKITSGLVGCPGTCPFIGVPHDMPSYRPMLAFTVDVLN